MSVNGGRRGRRFSGQMLHMDTDIQNKLYLRSKWQTSAHLELQLLEGKQSFIIGELKSSVWSGRSNEGPPAGSQRGSLSVGLR